MPAVRVRNSSRKGLLLRYDSLIEVVDVDANRPEEEFSQGGLVAESSVCGHARLLWTRSAMQEPENEMATRLVHQRVQGDALLVFHHNIPWLRSIDSTTQYTTRTLLQVCMNHAFGGLSKHSSHPVRPCIRALVASILSLQAFPPRVNHKKSLDPYPPHGTGQDTQAEPGSLQPIRASFDRSSTPPHPSTAVQRDIPSATAEDASSFLRADIPPSVPGQSDTGAQSSSTTNARHYHPGHGKGCSCSNPPPQIHAIHRYLAKKRLQQEQPQPNAAAPAAPAAPVPAATVPAATVPAVAAPGMPASETRKHAADAAADDDDLSSHKRVHREAPEQDAIAGRVRDSPAEASARASAMDAQPGGSAVEISPVSAPPPADDAGDAPADEDASPVAAPAAATPEAARAAVTSHWQALHPDVLHLVYQKLHCQDLVTASCVCVGWREAALRDREVLGDVGVKLSQQPLRHPVALSAALGMRALARLEWLLVPRVVMAAADLAGNGGACFLCASVCEARADLVGAAGYWKKAAKTGHPGAMYKLGTHFYRGDITSLGRSGEDAVMWLQRFLKLADTSAIDGIDPAKAEDPAGPEAAAGSAEEPPVDAAAAADGGSGIGGSMLGVVGRQARLRQRRANTVLEEQVARASLLLGYLHMDGEGTKASNLEAVRHMRRAALLGDEEAHRTLGWMYNTGQFGEGS